MAKMEKFKVEYTHVEETTYSEWVIAESEQEALDSVENAPSLNERDVTSVQGIETKDFKVTDSKWIGPGSKGYTGG